jgi:diguanylate cyclase (GGDEF)-like protein
MDRKTKLVTKDKLFASEDLTAMMGRCDRREWWLWSAAIFVMILLTLSVASFALPAVISGADAASTFSLAGAARGLLGLVLVFDLYVIYEQLQLSNLRQEFANRLYKLAVADSLTGLFNRRYIEHQLVTEIAHCRRHGVPLTVILFDLDSFKQVNDQYGHTVGDEVLKMFAEQLQKATRGSDLVARYGGDEFLVLLPECEPDGAQSILSRLNGNLVETAQAPMQLQYSAGWTTYNLGESPTEFLKRADEVLYANKRERRTSMMPTTDVRDVILKSS